MEVEEAGIDKFSASIGMDASNLTACGGFKGYYPISDRRGRIGFRVQEENPSVSGGVLRNDLLFGATERRDVLVFVEKGFAPPTRST